MNEFENIHADTALDDREVRELVARLTNPSTRQDQRTKVRDIAETMDIDVETVLSTLQDIRLKRQTEIPVEAAKLAAELEVMKTPVRKKVSMAPPQRLIVASALLFALMLTASGLVIRSAYAREPEIRKSIEKENYEKHYTEMSSKERAAYEAKMNASH